MNSIQDYNPDQYENEEKYWDLVKRIGKIEEKLNKMDKANEEDESEMEWDPDAVEGMTDKWIFDRIASMCECLSSLVAIGKKQMSLNDCIIENIKDLGRKFDKTTNAALGHPPVINDRAAQNIRDMSKKLSNSLVKSFKANPTKEEPFGGLSLTHTIGWVDGKHIGTVDDIKETKDGYVVGDLAGPDDGLHTEGSNDPAKIHVDIPNLNKAAWPTIVNPIGRAQSYYIDGDQLEYIIHVMLREEYHPAAIRYDDHGVDIVFSKNENDIVSKVLRLNKVPK